ncbi:MAG: hypothetical protein Q9207_004508, partial [Kuettlingeria erythrocarpa]
MLVGSPTKNDNPSVLQPPPLEKVVKTSLGEEWGARYTNGTMMHANPIICMTNTIASIFGSKRA